MDEEHPLNPRSPYAATKAGGDRLAYSYFVTYGLPIVIVRPFNNYGPRQHPEKVIPRFITQALTGEPLTIHGDGHASRDWLYVDDDAEAIEAIIAADIDGLAGEVVNVATGIDISVKRRRGLGARGGRRGRGEGLRRGAARPGRPPHRLDRQARGADRLARPDELRARARADRRLVPRERGLVEGAPQLATASPRPRSRARADRAPARGTRARPLRDRGRPRPRGARLRLRGQARARLDRGRAGHRPPRARRERRRDRLARSRLARRSRGARRRAARASAPDRRRDRGARDDEVSASGSASPRPGSRSRGCSTSPSRPASSRRPTARGSAG